MPDSRITCTYSAEGEIAVSAAQSMNRTILLRSMLFLMLALFVAVAIVPAAQAATYDTEEIEFLYLLNNYRQQNGRGPLQVNQKLSNASDDYSLLMGQLNCFSHTCGNTTFESRIRAAGYGYNTPLGENLAAWYSTAEQVFEGWRNSAGHNTNMLYPDWCAVGIGRVYVPGSANGWYWTTDFGGVCENDPQPTLDTTPPVVLLYNHSGLASGLFTLMAQASDNVGVNRVDFSIDNVLVTTDYGAPYTSLWNTLSAGGNHTVKVVAFDAAGNYSQASYNINVNNFNPTREYVFTWYDQSNSDWRDWVLMANPQGGTGTARTAVTVGGYNYVDNNIVAGSPAVIPQFPGIMGGSVKVNSTQPLITSQRVVYKGSFNEIAGLPVEDLESTYYFAWYDAVGMRDWILIGNEGNQQASVQVFIAGQLKGTYSIPVGGQITPEYAGVMNGPVKVVSTNNQPLIVSQRTLYGTAFNEVWGVPGSKIGPEYNFSWYDSRPQNSMNGNWILIGNMDVQTASVNVYISDQLMGQYTIEPGQRVSPQFPDVAAGPVRVVSTNGKDLIVSQRIIYKNSFEEFQGLTAADFGTDFWFTWYDSIPANGMNGNWILIANKGNAIANVDVYVGYVKKGTYNIAPGGIATPSYANLMAGPVRVVSTNGQPLMTTQRVIYLNSFNEIAGLTL